MRELIVELAIDMHNEGLGIYQTSTPSTRNIFTGHMPQDINEGILLVQVPAAPPEQYIDTEYPIIDIWVKAAHTDRAYALLRDVYDIYHRRYHYDFPDWHIYFSRALGTIVDVDRDQEYSKLLRLSVQFITRNLNNIS